MDKSKIDKVTVFANGKLIYPERRKCQNKSCGKWFKPVRGHQLVCDICKGN